MTCPPLARVLPLFLCILLLAPAVGCSAEHDRLQRLVTRCLDTSGEAYCTVCEWPRADSACAAATVCTASTEVWRESTSYVAIRDRKMCSCSQPGFVHGLAIPRALVPGVEGNNRPNGIWPFAWQTALEKGIPPNELALVVNPRHDRSENQLHVHLVRLKEDARERFPAHLTVLLPDMDRVWNAAAARAGEAGLTDYGVLVARNPQGGYTLVLDPGSPEDHYTVARCPKEPARPAAP